MRKYLFQIESGANPGEEGHITISRYDAYTPEWEGEEYAGDVEAVLTESITGIPHRLKVLVGDWYDLRDYIRHLMVNVLEMENLENVRISIDELLVALSVGAYKPDVPMDTTVEEFVSELELVSPTDFID